MIQKQTKQKKNLYIFILLSMLIVFVFLSFNKKISSDSSKKPLIELTIDNETESTIEGLTIHFVEGQEPIELDSIKAKDLIKFEIKAPSSKLENSMILKYKDYNGEIHNNILIGYIFPKSYRIPVRIALINDYGIISFDYNEQ